MKAKEYVEKYFSTLPETAEECEKISKELLRDFHSEILSLIEKRGIKIDSGAVGIIREMNEKWNSICNRTKKKFGFKILCRNVIWNVYLANKFPDEYKRKEN